MYKRQWPSNLNRARLREGYLNGMYDLTWKCLHCEFKDGGHRNRRQAGEHLGIYFMEDRRNAQNARQQNPERERNVDSRFRREQ